MDKFYQKVTGTFVLKFIGLLLAFVFQIFLGQNLKPSLYGEFTMYITYSNILSVISILGMDSILIKEVGRLKDKDKDKDSKANALLKFTFFVSFLIIIFLFTILFIIGNVFNLFSYSLTLILSLVIIKTLISVLDGYFQGKGKILEITIYNSIVNGLLKLFLFFILIYLQFDTFISAILSFIISEVISLILRARFFIKSINSFLSNKADYNKTKIGFEEKKIFLSYSITVGLTSGINILIQSLDKIIIENFLDLNSVGLYKVALNYANLISVFIVPFIAFWPIISRLYSENRIKEIESRMKVIVRIVTFLVLPMFFLFYFLGSELLQIFGTQYNTYDAKQLLIILAFSYLIDALSGPIGSILTMTKHAKLVLYNNFISLLINIVISVIFIQHYGLIGVAIGTGISLIFINIISIIQVKYLLNIFSYNLQYFLNIIIYSFLNFIIINLLLTLIITENTYIRIFSIGIFLYLINFLFLFIFNFKYFRTIFIEKKNNFFH